MASERALRTGTLIIGAGQAGLAAALPPEEARAAVPRGRRGRAYRRPLAEPLGLASAVQSGGGRRPARDGLPRAGCITFRPAARWAISSRPTRIDSAFPVMSGTLVEGVRQRRGWRVRGRGREAATSPQTRSSSRAGPSGTRGSPRSRTRSTHRSASSIRASTATRRSFATVRCSSSGSATRALTSHSRSRRLIGPTCPARPLGEFPIKAVDTRRSVLGWFIVQVPRDPRLHVGHPDRSPDGSPRPEWRWPTPPCPERATCVMRA